MDEFRWTDEQLAESPSSPMVLGFRSEPGPLTVTALDLLYINADERGSLFDWLDAEWSNWWRDLIWSMTLGEGVVDMERYTRPMMFMRDWPLVFTETRRISCLPPHWPTGRAADRFESIDDVPVLAMGYRTEALTQIVSDIGPLLDE